MAVLDELKNINDAIKSLAEFVQKDKAVKSDFTEYLRTMGISDVNSVEFHSACFNYIFERNLGEDRKSILQLFLDNSKGLSAQTKKIVKNLQKSMALVFEVKKVTKNGFELYNLVNEKEYTVVSLVKMTTFRGIGAGQFVVARIFELEKVHYLLEISGVLASTKKDDALRYAVAKIIQNPELVYFDNAKKQKEIEKDIAKIYKSFMEYFDKEEIITTNKLADDLIGLFNDFAESGEKTDYLNKVEKLPEYKFFNVSEFNNSYENFLENSLGGFSSHKELYDVGIVFDKELGMYAVPFYGTFNKIFEADNFKKIQNFAQCINYFLTNDKFPANLIKRVADKFENFMPIVNEVLEKEYTLDELLHKYKPQYMETKIFSSTTVLYKSKAFSSTLGLIEESENRPQIDTTNVGRNDLCPCGSGKKFKKCCMLVAH